MLFCPKCGAIMKPTKEEGKTIMSCSCGYKSDSEPMKITEAQSKGKEGEVVDPEVDLKTLPKTSNKRYASAAYEGF